MVVEGQRAPVVSMPASDGATVKDNLTNFAKGNIKLSVNGALVSSSKYAYSSSKLTKGKKTIEKEAMDRARNAVTKNWYFTTR